ncbi:MAG: hypothetical protein EPN43_12230, partial [Jatrophihabitans sp.]
MRRRRSPERARPGRSGGAGVLLVLWGGSVVLLAFTRLEWKRRPHGGDVVGRIDFAALRRNLDHFPAAGRPAASVAYFAWLAWALLLVLIVVGLAANLPTRAAPALATTGFALGLAGAGLTYYTLTRYAQATHDLFGTSSSALDNSEDGTWFALGGYLAAGVGAALGLLPRVVR